MKLRRRIVRICRSLVIPHTGMWIEMSEAAMLAGRWSASSPTRGMWIEMSQSSRAVAITAVIPHTGDVD